MKSLLSWCNAGRLTVEEQMSTDFFQGFEHELHAILCLAENAISADAARPDDVIYSYSGKSIEINNTDAEGRLVLADGVGRCAFFVLFCTCP